jgi:DNA-binding CsgD family transcriptional regulator
MSSDTSQISEREREILRLVATGATNQQIAYQLNISVNTVKVHLRNIFGKIGVTSRTEATLYAVRSGLVQIGEAAGAPTAVAEPPPEEAEPLLTDLENPSRIGDGSNEAREWVIAPADPIVVTPAPPARRQPWLLGGGLLAVLLIAGAIVFFGSRIGTPNAPAASPSSAGEPTPDARARWHELAPMPSGRAGFALASYNSDNSQFF